MAFNTQALRVSTVPTGPSGIQILAQGLTDIGDTRREKEQTDLVNKQNQQRIDAQTAKDKRAIEASGNKLSLEEYGRDLVGIKSLRESADNVGVATVLNNRVKRILAKNPDADVSHTQNLMKLFDENPDRFDVLVDSELAGLIRTDVIKTDGTVGGTRGTLNINAPIRLVKRNADGKVIEEKLVSPQAHKTTGELTLEPFVFEEGFELAKETDEEKRIADVLASQQKAIDKLQAELKFKPQTQAEIKIAEAAVKKADAVFEQVDKIRQNNINLQVARQAVVDGAGTGPILSLLPSFRAQSVAFDAAQGRLGLDVVGSVTFGALSKGELDLAKAVALPAGLDGPELIQWIDDKIDANIRAADYMERQGVFLSQSGNTKADWIQAERAAMDTALESGGVTEEDIKETMRANNMDRSEVLTQIRRRFESGGA